MRLKLTECMGIDCGLFRDLATYDSMYDYVKAIIEGKDAFQALDVQIKFGGKGYRLRSSGELTSEAKLALAKLRRQPKELKMIPNDWMAIIADNFEQELYIDLDPDTAPYIDMNRKKA